MLRAEQGKLPAHSTVLVAGHDTWNGAYVWRNGFGLAARIAGLRQDVVWRLGTAAVLERPQWLGSRAFELSVPGPGRLIDWTSCQIALRQSARQTLAGVPFAPFPGTTTSHRPWSEVSPPIAATSTSLGAAVLRLEKALASPLSGRLWWRGVPRDRFTVTRSRAFLIPTGRRMAIIRLPVALDEKDAPGFRIHTDLLLPPGVGMELTLIERPAECLATSGIIGPPLSFDTQA